MRKLPVSRFSAGENPPNDPTVFHYAPRAMSSPPRKEGGGERADSARGISVKRTRFRDSGNARRSSPPSRPVCLGGNERS